MVGQDQRPLILGLLVVTSHLNSIVHVIARERAQCHFQVERIVLNQQNLYLFMIYCVAPLSISASAQMRPPCL